jgi:hypothetical protein
MKTVKLADVRPRIPISIYRIVRLGAADKLIPERLWLIQAIQEYGRNQGIETTNQNKGDAA